MNMYIEEKDDKFYVIIAETGKVYGIFDTLSMAHEVVETWKNGS